MRTDTRNKIDWIIGGYENLEADSPDEINNICTVDELANEVYNELMSEITDDSLPKSIKFDGKANIMNYIKTELQKTSIKFK